MKIPKEHLFLIIVGLFLLSYLLSNIVTPINIKLPTPYAFLKPSIFSKYPFTVVVVLIRAISLFVTPLFFFSFITGKPFVKAGSALIIATLGQLYSLQQLISGTTLIPMEWAISLSIAGALLLIPAFFWLLQGVFFAASEKIKKVDITFEEID